MTVVEKICRARSGGSFLHDDYTHIAHLQIDLPIDVEGIDRSRRENRAGRQREHLIIVTESFGVWEEQLVCEMVLQVRIEWVCGTGVRSARGKSRE